MKYLLFILAITFLSCSKERRMHRRCVKYASYCVKSDSTTTITHDTLYRDTTVFISQVADTVILDNPCAILCDSVGNLKPFLRTQNDRGIVTTIRTVNNRLEVNCAVDSLEHLIDSLTVVNARIKTTVTNIVPTALPETWWQKNYRYWSWITWAALALLFAYKRLF